MTAYSKGLLIGRFQPFHKGHLYLLHHVRKRVKKLVIGIGSANVFDEGNPFSYEDRKKMIEKVIHEEKLDNFVEKIVPLNDYYDDKLWFKNTLQKTGKIDVVIGNNEWPNHIFESRGYRIWRVGFFKKYLYEGVRIRKLIQEKKQWQDRVPDYLISPMKKLFTRHKTIPYRFQHIALGGTFDHFHKGHKEIINTALRYGKDIFIGITTEEMYKSKNFSESIEPFEDRKKTVENYFKRKKALKRVTFFPLSDIYGPTAYDGTIEAVVVSKFTYPNAIKINILREQKSLPELKIICIKDVKDKKGKLISSERIRDNLLNKTLILPEYLRKELRKPLGKVIRGKENELEITAKKILQLFKKIKPTMIIAVGDIIANSLEKIDFTPDVKIIDYRSRRHPIKNSNFQFQFPISNNIINKPGTISKESVNAIKKAIQVNLEPVHPKGRKKQQIIVINGEEDLLALPAILLAPIGSIVLYGQIDLGVIVVTTNEETKNNISKILHKFK